MVLKDRVRLLEERVEYLLKLHASFEEQTSHLEAHRDIEQRITALEAE